MRIPYRTRKLLQRMGIALLILLLVGALAFGGWLLLADKNIYYTRDGAVMDKNMLPISQEGELAVPPKQEDPVPIYYNEGDNQINTSRELTQLVGYYIDAEQLLDIPAVKAQLQALPKGTPVMIEVKNIYGAYYYSSAITTTRSSNIDAAAMDELLSFLDQRGAYTIAKLPGLRDKEFGLNNDQEGVFHSSRGYLWMDEEGCYWLNPGREAVISHLTRSVNELKGLGFDEVVFDDFCFPETDNIYVDGDKAELIATAAKTLVGSCATEAFAVSFVGKADFPLPEGRTRLYVKSAAASEAAALAQETGLEDPAMKLVFLTENHDTRFEEFSVLRPLSAAH